MSAISGASGWTRSSEGFACLFAWGLKLEFCVQECLASCMPAASIQKSSAEVVMSWQPFASAPSWSALAFRPLDKVSEQRLG